jgi:hypothetical protein
MITRWQDISKRVANKLGVSEAAVKAALEDMAKKIAAHASHPSVMETDLFGVGTLKCTYGKLIKRVESLKRIIRVRERFRDGPARRGKTVPQEVRDRHNDFIIMVQKDIETFNEFIAQKNDIYLAKGRARYIKATLEGNELSRKDLGTLKKKAYLGKPPESRAFKTMQREKEREQRRKDRASGLLLRNGKRRAKRIKGWIHPDLR